MGIILKTKLDNNALVCLSSNSVSLSITPYNIYEAGVSPQCTLPVKKITGASLLNAFYEVNVIISSGLPSMLFAITLLLK